MALTCSKTLFLKLLIKNNNNNINFLSGPSYQCFVPLVYYSQKEYESSQENISRAMKAYLDKAKKYDEFLKEQMKEYNLGKTFLAGMMGKKQTNMSQLEVDEAIEFLFPSSLFSKHARPKFKPPEELFERKKETQFDFSGRPYHFLYYTTKPNYSQMLHNSAKKLQELQLYEQKYKKAGVVEPAKIQYFCDSSWLSHKDLEKKLFEKLKPLEYEKFLEVFTRLAEHPFSYLAEDFIREHMKKFSVQQTAASSIPLPDKEGIFKITTNGSRKTAKATVKVSYPGSGKIEINGTGLDYFLTDAARWQVVLPLLFTEMENRVDVTATTTGGGEMGQAGAVRYGISTGLKDFVSTEMLAKMKLAGLLQKDIRTKERKKVGREGARRGYTWLKR